MVVNVKKAVGGYSFIGSRGSGEIIRKIMKKELSKEDGNVTLDFSGVEQVTQSFIDEFFGIFVRAFGVEYIRGRVRLVNETEGTKFTINYVIKYSIAMAKEAS